jgi:hypothetical protein
MNKGRTNMERDLSTVHENIASVGQDVADLRSEIEMGFASLGQALSPLESMQYNLRYDVVFDVENSISEVGMRIATQLEDAMAYLNDDLSPGEVAFRLKYHRTNGYEFFGVHAEQWQDDPEIARAEQRLYEILCTPIIIADFYRNRSELGAWIDLGCLYADGSSIERSDLLERADKVTRCTNGVIPADSPKRIWTVMAKNSKSRDKLRSMYLPRVKASTDNGAQTVTLKRTASKRGTKLGGPSPIAAKRNSTPRRSSKTTPKSSNGTRRAPKIAS